MAPAVSLKQVLRGSYKKTNIFISSLLTLVDKIKMGNYSSCDGAKSLEGYNGKIMVIQSKNDNVVSFDSSLGYIKNRIGDKAEYVELLDRFHNPDYKKEAVDKLMKFYAEMSKCSKDKLKDLFAKQDFRAMGELDPIVMDKIIDFIKR